MQLKSVLLGSASLLTVGVAGQTGGAVAASAGVVTVPNTFNYSVEGAWLTGKDATAADKLGTSAGPFAYDPATVVPNVTGYRGAITLGTQLNPNWDVQGGFSANQQLDNTFFASGGSLDGPFGSQITTNFSFQTLDFDAGYTPKLDDKFDIRIFGGLRGLHYTDSVDKLGDVFGPGESIQAHETSDFLGLGPRAGVQGSTKFGQSPFGISGMLSAAAIYGLENRDASLLFSGIGGSGGPPPASAQEWKTVYDIEAALGLDYYVNPNTKFTLGYRVETITNIGMSSAGSFQQTDDGVFLKLSGSL